MLPAFSMSTALAVASFIQIHNEHPRPHSVPSPTLPQLPLPKPSFLTSCPSDLAPLPVPAHYLESESPINMTASL